MRREIKFKGKSLLGEWHIGNLTILPDNYMHREKGTYISNSSGMPFAYHVRFETVGEYFGLKDCKRQEVFEGDLCKTDGDMVGEVVLHNLTWMLRCGPDAYYPLGTWVEIIGNIHDDAKYLVKFYLNAQVNENETMLEFIRNSESEFGMEVQELELFSLNELKKYVDFLDELWCK